MRRRLDLKLLGWIKNLARTEAAAIHHPWRVGHYVTYYLELPDGSWTAFAITVAGRTDAGYWILRGDFKTRLGECIAWFRSDPNAKPDDIDPLPGRHEVIRGSAAIEKGELRDDPQLQTSLAMNLLLARRMPGARAALRETAHPASYPCGIDRVHRFVTPGPGYSKCHDLNPRVRITGVACLSINEGENPMVATSFGLNDPNAEGAVDCDDFVDFSHVKETRHDSFILSYPATWFLRSQPARDDASDVRDYFAQVGGITCSCSLSVSLRHGSLDRLHELRSETIARLSKPVQGPMGTLVPQSPTRPARDGDESPYSFRLNNPGIDGLACGSVILDASHGILAQVDAFGCVSKGNPRREAILSEMAVTLPAIVDSFHLVRPEA